LTVAEESIEINARRKLSSIEVGPIVSGWVKVPYRCGDRLTKNIVDHQTHIAGL